MTDPVVIDARDRAYRRAIDCLATCAPPNAKPTAEAVMALAKQIETWFWGGFAPIERAPTPLTTIEEAAAATRERVAELAQNSADAALGRDLMASLAQYERFLADVTSAIQRAQERAGRPLAAE